MPKMPCKEPKITQVKLHCYCKLPDFIDDTIACYINTAASGSMKNVSLTNQHHSIFQPIIGFAFHAVGK